MCGIFCACVNYLTRRRVALALVTFIQLRIVLGVPLDRSSRAASRDNVYNQLVGTLAAGVDSACAGGDGKPISMAIYTN